MTNAKKIFNIMIWACLLVSIIICCVGCGIPETDNNNEEVTNSTIVKNIEVEEIIVEDILVEDVETEEIYVLTLEDHGIVEW